ncbi:hypothetical protein VJ923_04160 [Adlercreutzia sp. R25]|uniref:DUF4853 domain-containing protein n=1 Tax=Adlercreutzia shanghongiae TaxID=3111773 RepID=A0ABU6IWP6_9ACTN|nr:MULTISPECIES: hypothetical protein [unclassified Adlercreutzia]MEC4272354.1 hypothetical protein [Adlercreutzia sp. R25]MEC4294220.1 hypothetical protein [Adlercreutzia sp. R22]
MNRPSENILRLTKRASLLAIAAVISVLTCACTTAESIARPQPALGDDYAIALEAARETRSDATLVGVTMKDAASDAPASWCYVFGSEEAGCFYVVNLDTGDPTVVPSMESHWRSEIWQRVAEASPTVDADEAYGNVCDEYLGGRCNQSYRMSYFAYAPADNDTAELSNEWIISVFDPDEEGEDAGSGEAADEQLPPSSRSFSVDAVTGAVSPLQ